MCCGYAFSVGDVIRWPVESLNLSSLPVELATSVTLVREEHSDDTLPTVTGRIASILLVPEEGGTSKSMTTLPSGAQTQDPTYAGELHGQFSDLIGYVVELTDERLSAPG